MKDKIKIILLVPTLRIGGLQSLVYTLNEEMINLGHNSIIYNLGLSSDITPFDVKRKINIISCERPNKAGILTELKTIKKFIKFINKFKPDIIQSHTGISDLYLSIIRNHSIFIKIRCQITPESFYTRPIIGYFLENYYFKYRFHHFVVVNNKIRKKLISLKVKKNKITFINNPIPKWATDHSLISKKNINKNINISFLGRLSYEKGADRVINIFSQLLENFDNNLKLIIGGKGSKRKNLLGKISQLNLEKKILMRGFVEDIVSFYSESDIVINTSRIEGVPITLLEAASLGCSIIATKTEASDELLKLIPNIYLIENKDMFEKDEIQHLSQWIKIQINRKKRKINLYSEAIKMLNPKNVTEEYLSLYSSFKK